MGTIRQKKLAHAIVQNLKAKKPKNKKELLVSAGYSKTTAEATPQDIIAQEGVQEELEALGFSEETAKRVVGEILENEEEESRDRLKAAEMVFKVKGSFVPEVSEESRGNTYNFLFAGDVQKDIKQFEDALKAKLLGHDGESQKGVRSTGESADSR